MGRKLRIYELSRVSRKTPDLAKWMDFYFDDILKQLSLLGIDVRAGETLTEFSARVDRRLKLEDRSFTAVARIQMRMHFAEAMPAAKDCETVFLYHSGLESILRERLSKRCIFSKRP